jgi:hypothetical protein
MFLVACKKENNQKDVSTCALQMKEFFKDELRCTKQDWMEVNLYSGIYNGERIYFTMIMCINCGVVSPTYGYNCKQEKVSFQSLSKVEAIEEVYNSCTEKFIVSTF